MRLLLLGPDGLLGTAMRAVAGADPRVTGLTAAGRDEVDVTRADQVAQAVGDLRPDAVVNTAALMPADRCDDLPAEAYAVNALGPRNVSRACARIGAVPVYISTDFVFDGKAATPYQVDSLPRPLLTYGITKLAGEHEMRLGSDRSLVARTACLFGPPPRSPRARACFVDRMLDRAATGAELTVVDNVITSPTYTRDLAAMVLELLHSNAPAGVYQTVNQGPKASWYELCKAAIAGAALPGVVRPTQEQSFTTAARPLHTPLTVTLPPAALRRNRPWREALTDFLALRRRTLGELAAAADGRAG